MEKAVPLALGRKRLSPSVSDLEFLAGELLGLNARVETSGGKDLQGLEGRVVDETRNTFVIRTLKGLKTIPKKGCVFSFEGLRSKVDGSVLVCRPEDRTKKMARLAGRVKKNG